VQSKRLGRFQRLEKSDVTFFFFQKGFGWYVLNQFVQAYLTGFICCWTYCWFFPLDGQNPKNKTILLLLNTRKTNTLYWTFPRADPGGRAVKGLGLRLNRGFESHWGHGCSTAVFVARSVGTGLCDDLITRLESYVCVSNCLIVCDLETSTTRRHIWAVAPPKYPLHAFVYFASTNAPSCISSHSGNLRGFDDL
jgi:hypothetical protein